MDNNARHQNHIHHVSYVEGPDRHTEYHCHDVSRIGHKSKQHHTYDGFSPVVELLLLHYCYPGIPYDASVTGVGSGAEHQESESGCKSALHREHVGDGVLLVWDDMHDGEILKLTVEVLAQTLQVMMREQTDQMLPDRDCVYDHEWAYLVCAVRQVAGVTLAVVRREGEATKMFSPHSWEELCPSEVLC